MGFQTLTGDYLKLLLSSVVRSRKAEPLWLILLLLLASTLISSAKPVGDVRIINTNSGTIMTAHADQYRDKVFISGLANRPSGLGGDPHVDAWGLAHDGRILFFKRTSVTIMGKPSFIRTESFVIPVDPVLFSKATVVYVTFSS